MENRPITKKQEEILNYIKDEILERGFPPAVREMCQAVGLKSTSSVHSHLESLEKNGYIRRDPTKPRAIEILESESFNTLRRDGQCSGRRYSRSRSADSRGAEASTATSRSRLSTCRTSSLSFSK